MSVTSEEVPFILVIFISSLVGMLWACLQYWSVVQVDVRKEFSLDPELQGLNNDKREIGEQLEKIGEKIASGASAFLWAEYRIMASFVVLFGVLVYVIVDCLGAKDGSGTKYIPFATIAFIIGSVTSIACGFLGMKIAVLANFRTTYRCMESLEAGFSTAYRAGCVMGFGMVSVSLAVLAGLI